MGNCAATPAVAGQASSAVETSEEEVQKELPTRTAFGKKVFGQEANDHTLFDTWTELDLADETQVSPARYDDIRKALGSVTAESWTMSPYKTPAALSARTLGHASPSLSSRRTSHYARCNDLTGSSDRIEFPPDSTQTKLLLQPTDQLDLAMVEAFLDAFVDDKLIPEQTILEILLRAHDVLMEHTNVVETTIPPKSHVCVVGDLHGQFADLMTIFELNGRPNERNRYLFNGDFVDRGPKSIEIVVTLLSFKLLYPAAIFLNRGNHESEDQCFFGGLHAECVRKYNADLFYAICDCFAALPLATLLITHSKHRVMVMHGGLFSDEATSIATINSADRHTAVVPADTPMSEIMWSDPMKAQGRMTSPRGQGLRFGADICESFMEANDLHLIIRSHECCVNGYKNWFGGKLVTVFSASNYGRSANNEAAVVVVKSGVPTDSKVKLDYIRFVANTTEKDRGGDQELRDQIVRRLRGLIQHARPALSLYFRRLMISKQEKLERDRKAARAADPSKADALDEGKPRVKPEVTREEWEQGLQFVLKLPSIDFLAFAKELSLPALGVDFKTHGPIDPFVFLNQYRVSSKTRSQWTHASLGSEQHQQALRIRKKLQGVVATQRVAITQMYEVLDLDGDGVVTVEEAVQGFCGLMNALHCPVSEADMGRLIDSIDDNKDGVIQIEELMEFLDEHDGDEEELEPLNPLEPQAADRPAEATPRGYGAHGEQGGERKYAYGEARPSL